MSKPQRKSPRLDGYDYSQSGAYFVTICTYEKQHIFGHIRDSVLHLNDIGQLATNHIKHLSTAYDNVTIDDFVVMPNHVHSIIFLSDRLTNKPTLSNIVGGYKSGVTRIAHRDHQFSGKLWQPRFHDHIIRNQDSLNNIRQYVQTNPERWGEDCFND